MKKETRIAFRTSEDLKARLTKAAATVRLSESQLSEACVEALCDYIEENGNVTLPITITTKTAPPRVLFPSTAVRDLSVRSSLNEEPAPRTAVPSPASPGKRIKYPAKRAAKP